MALIVEDGTGLATAESFISVTDADSYFTAHGSPSAWSDLTTAQKESALRYATLWVDRRYAWPGEIRYPETPQALSFPLETGAEDMQGRELAAVPQAVKDATCEAALAHVAGALNELPGLTGVAGLVESATVGPLSVKLSKSAPAARSFSPIDRILSIIAFPKSLATELIRG